MDSYMDIRLTQVFKTSEEVDFDNSSKIILFSDCHRGDGSWADNFAPNQILFSTALDYYYRKDFTYIEIGDGDELWENRKFTDIKQTHCDVFRLMGKFHDKGRMHMIYGNHDIMKKNKAYVEKNFNNLNCSTDKTREPMFSNIKMHEGLILKHKTTGNKIFIVHGHQGELLNDRLWPIARFLVRYIIRPLELMGFRSPASPMYNRNRKIITENRIMNWAKVRKQMTIAGHTHRPIFPAIGRPSYFNDGCCVRRGFITGIEIENGEISLVKWSTKTNTDGILYVCREIINGPEKLTRFF